MPLNTMAKKTAAKGRCGLGCSCFTGLRLPAVVTTEDLTNIKPCKRMIVLPVCGTLPRNRNDVNFSQKIEQIPSAVRRFLKNEASI